MMSIKTTTFCPSDGTPGSVEHQSVGNFEHFVVKHLRWNISQLEMSIFFQTGKKGEFLVIFILARIKQRYQNTKPNFLV